MRFHKLEEYLRTPMGARMLGIGDGSADFAQLVKDAQKFYVGDVCILEGIAQPRDFPRLPYSMCVFEMQDVDPSGVKQTFFLLAEEIGDSEPAYDRVRVHSFCPYPAPRRADDLWLHSGYLDVDRRSDTFQTFVNGNTLKFLGPTPSLGVKRLADQNMIERSVISSGQFLSRFLSVLNCSNVEINEIAEPATLNKQRLKKGKVPIYAYKTLVLKTRQRRLAAGYGTHESPRIHLRRGHIKRRKTGNFWWEPCVVGDRARGIVVKDYRADRLTAPSAVAAE